jgi:16S rRNA processing protein RimM
LGTDVLIAIAYVGRPYGIKGEVKADVLTDFPDRFQRVKTITAVPPGVRLTLEYHKWIDKSMVLKFEEINSRKEAEVLRGSYLKIGCEELEPLPPGHYYIFQLIGLKVFTVGGKYLGKVRDVLRPGGNDVYVIEAANGGRDILVPAVKEFIKDINLDTGKVLVRPIPGLIDGEKGDVPDEV